VAPSAAASPAAAAGACSATTEAATVNAAMDGRAFVPASITAKVGDVIAFTNKDGVPHTATLDDGSCTTDRLGKDKTGALTFSAAGTYPFHCQVHPDMTGTFEITS
jgi:plastocyanin